MRQMKKYILLLVVALMTTMSVQAKKVYEDDESISALQISLAEMIHKYSTNADTLVIELSKKFSKNARVQTAIARAYFRNNERSRTRAYIEKALKINPQFSPAFHLKGLSYGEYDQKEQQYVLAPSEADSACYWFDKAIAANPTDPQPYVDYADAMSWKDMAAAEAKLEALRIAVPSYNVDLAKAELYEKKINRSKQYSDQEAYRQKTDSVLNSIDPHKLSSNQLSKFVMASFWANNTVKAEELASVGVENFPNNKDYSRVLAWAASRNGRYELALKSLDNYYRSLPADSLDKIDLRSMDFLTSGTAKLNLGRYTEAIDDFGKALNTNDDYTSQMPPQINSAFNAKFRQLLAEKNYREAYEMYLMYIATLDKDSQEDKWGYMLEQYASQITDDSSSENNKAVLEYIGRMVTEMEKQYPDYSGLTRAYYLHAVYTIQILDPESSEGISAPLCQKVIDQVSKKPFSTLTSSEKQYAATACSGIAFYHFKGQNDTKTAIKYWQKALYYNPEDTQAYSVLSQLKALPKGF